MVNSSVKRFTIIARYEPLIKTKVFTNNIGLLTVSLESVHHNYLVKVTYTSLLHPTEPDRLVQKNFGRILSKNGIHGAFNWLDCVYTIDMNAYDQY
jgi:hypothetical protein